MSASTYYDIDAILTDAQKVPCTFELSVPNLGYLEGNPGQELKSGTKLHLPLWLSSMLAVSHAPSTSPLVTLDIPASLGPRVLNALKADARSIDLRALAPHYYALGALMLELFDDDDLVDVLTETLQKRCAEVADQAHNARGGVAAAADFLAGLDEQERLLFRAAHDSAKAVKAWMAGIKTR